MFKNLKYPWSKYTYTPTKKSTPTAKSINSFAGELTLTVLLYTFTTWSNKI